MHSDLVLKPPFNNLSKRHAMQYTHTAPNEKDILELPRHLSN